MSSNASTQRVFICGSALKGQPDHKNLQSATFLGPAKTASNYRIHAVKDGWHPGIYKVDAGKMAVEGVSIPGEVYELSAEQYEYLVSTEPPDMYPETVDLENGDQAIAMLYPKALIDAGNWPDISALGGWAAYKAKGAL